jgi:hypothetical protein
MTILATVTASHHALLFFRGTPAPYRVSLLSDALLPCSALVSARSHSFLLSHARAQLESECLPSSMDGASKSSSSSQFPLHQCCERINGKTPDQDYAIEVTRATPFGFTKSDPTAARSRVFPRRAPMDRVLSMRWLLLTMPLPDRTQTELV